MMTKVKIDELIDVQTLTYKWDVIELIPEFKKLKSCQQSPKWHGEGDAFIHTQKVCDAMVKLIKERCMLDDTNYRLVLMTAALFHDIGKGPATFFKEKDKSWHAYGHEFHSESMVYGMLVDEDSQFVNAVAKLVRYHMEPLDIKKTKAKVQKTFDLAHKVAPSETELADGKPHYYSCFRMLLLLKVADVMGSEQADTASKLDDLSFLENLYSFSFSAGIDGWSLYDYSFLI